MRPYELTRDAEADLEEITRYTIKEWGEVQAESYLAKIKPMLQKYRKKQDRHPDILEKIPRGLRRPL